MRVLITGGAGFIGSHFADACLEAGLDVVAIDNLQSGSARNLPPAARLVRAGVRKASLMREVMEAERPAFVVHLAAQMNVRHSIADPASDAEVNILGTVNVLRASEECGTRRVLFASSGGAIYGDQPEYPCTESVTAIPLSPYGVSKLTGEGYGELYARGGRLEFTSLRLANVYGPRQNPKGEAGVVSLFLERARKEKPVAIFGDGEQTRDYVWVGDVVDAFLRALTGAPGTYNVGTGVETSVNSLVDQLERAIARKVGREYRPAIPGEVRRNALSIRKAKEILGWRSSPPLEEGLRRTSEALDQSQRAGLPVGGKLGEGR